MRKKIKGLEDLITDKNVNLVAKGAVALGTAEIIFGVAKAVLPRPVGLFGKLCAFAAITFISTAAGDAVVELVFEKMGYRLRKVETA